MSDNGYYVNFEFYLNFESSPMTWYRGHHIILDNLDQGDRSFLITKKGSGVVIATAWSVSQAIDKINLFAGVPVRVSEGRTEQGAQDGKGASTGFIGGLVGVSEMLQLELPLR